MRIAHASDLHLGFHRYARMAPGGRNQRELDVANAFKATVDGIIAAAPDLVLIAGDVFDSGRPSNHADQDAVRGILRIRHALPKVPVLIVEGNHDEAKMGGGSPLAVLAQIGAKVVVKAERVALPSLDAHVLCVPDRDLRTVALEPGTESGVHLLLAHGSIGGRLASLPGADVLSAAAISPAFQYAALGDYHCVEQIAPNAWYSGAIEFTSSDPWREIGTPKGWLLIEDGSVTHQPVPTRIHIDLPQFSAAGLSAKEITAKVLGNIAATDCTNAVVRQVVHEMPRGVRAAMDTRAEKQATKDCLHFQFDERRPTVVHVGRQIAVTANIQDDAPDWLDALEAEDAAVIPETPDAACARRVAAIEAAAESGDLAALYALVDSHNEPAARTSAAA